MDTDDTKARKRRRGPAPLPPEEKRTHCVSVRLNNGEKQEIDSKRGRMQRGENLRCVAFDKTPSVVPEVNRQAWAELARVGANLNQIAKHLNMGCDPEFQELRQMYAALRMALIGARAP